MGVVHLAYCGSWQLYLVSVLFISSIPYLTLHPLHFSKCFCTCYIRIAAEVSQIIFSCEMPIQWEHSCLVCIMLGIQAALILYLFAIYSSGMVETLLKWCGKHKVHVAITLYSQVYRC